MDKILQPFIWVIGKILEGIYFCFSSIGIENVGICIIFLTIIIRMLMIPMTIKQQKFAKMNSVMNPEIQKIQAKYKNRKDQQSQLEQQEEIKAVYDKYGTSPTGSCLQLIIQMPILFALYRVIMNISDYITSTNPNINNFFGLNLSESPQAMLKAGSITIIAAFIIPVLSGLFQFLSVQLSTKINSAGMDASNNPMGSSMKVMNIMMPLFSVYMCYILSSGLGLYWVAGSVVMMLQQIFINIHLKKMDVNVIIEKNREKASAKAEKRKAKNGIYREKVIEASKINAKSVSNNNGMSAAEKEEKIQKAKEAMNKKSGSLASKAGMVNDYNNRNNK